MIKGVAVLSHLGKRSANCITSRDIRLQELGLVLQAASLLAHALHTFARGLPNNEEQGQVREKQNPQRAKDQFFPGIPGSFHIHVVSYSAVSSSVILSDEGVICSEWRSP